MTQPPASPPPGWYHADGDAAGTHRYWDGNAWVGGPVPMASAAAPPAPSAIMGGDKALPGLGLILADPWARIGARIIDGIILSVVGGLLSLPFVLNRIRDGDTGAFGGAGGQFGLEQYKEPALFAALVIGLVLGAAYEVGFIALKGATPGKMIVGARVVGLDGASPPGFERAGMRWTPALLGLIPFLSLVLGLLSLFWIFSDDRRRSLYDRVARTYVVKR